MRYGQKRVNLELVEHPRFVPFAGTCPVCNEPKDDLVDYGQGVGESLPHIDGPVPYHWFAQYGEQYSKGNGPLCPELLHPAHCATLRCSARRKKQVFKSLLKK